MMNCNKIKRLIDEAEQAEVLPFEASNHLNVCQPCRRFADERARLRSLLSGIPRVNAPVNFDAHLKARMAAKPSSAWLNPTLYFRFGAASAALCVAILALQYSGLISLTNTNASQDQNRFVATAPPPTANEPPVEAPSAPPVVDVPKPVVPSPAIQAVRFGKAGRVHASTNQVDDDFVAGAPRVIVRDNKGKEVELPMQPISVGAQSQLLRRAARATAAQPVVMQAVSF